MFYYSAPKLNHVDKISLVSSTFIYRNMQLSLKVILDVIFSGLNSIVVMHIYKKSKSRDTDKEIDECFYNPLNGRYIK